VGKRAALYARYSSDNQRIESITAQLRATNEYCVRKGHEVVKEYIDEAESGRFDDRPAYQAMMRDAKSGLFDVVVYHKIDRSARNESDFYYYKALLKRAGVSIEYAECEIADTPEGQMMESVLVGMAAYYSRNLAREAKKGMRENAYKAKHNGGKPPLGYDVTPEKDLVINESEAQIVRQIFAMRASGNGYGDIIAALNLAGHKTKRGTPFKKNSLHDLLLNEKYIGNYIFGRVATDSEGKRNNHKKSENVITVEGAVPTIIDRETWDRVQKQIEQDRRLAGSYKAKERYLLTGLISCICGSAMQGSKTTNQRSGTYSYYKCCSQQAGGSECKGRRAKKEAVEEFVLARLQEQLSGPAIPDLVARINTAMLALATEQAAEISALDAQKIKLETKIEKAKELYFGDILPKEELGQIVKEAREQVTAIDDRLREIKKVVQTAYFKPEQLFRLLSAYSADLAAGENLREIVQTFVEAVIIDGEAIEVHFKLGPDFWRPQGDGSPPPIKSTYDESPRNSRAFCYAWEGLVEVGATLQNGMLFYRNDSIQQIGLFSILLNGGRKSIANV
jgi:site-specific DNA recombinase